MTQTNFMLLDLARTTAAFALYPLFLLIPGYVAGWLANVVQFRQRRPITRVLLSLTLSISLTPLVTYLAARWASFTLVWALYAAVWLAFAAIMARRLRKRGSAGLRLPLPRDRATMVAILIAIGWMLVAAFSLVDLQIGDKLYYSVTAHDYTKNISVTDAITRTGVPPINPSYHPAQPVELFYYYFWFLLCSLMDRLGGGAIDARGAVFGATLWAGLGVMALVALGLRFLQPNGARNIRMRAVVGIALLGVSGLDVIPVVLHTVSSFALGEGAFHSSPESWNEQVSAWTGSMLWVPHHLASLIACLTGLLLLRTLNIQRPLRAQRAPILFAAIAFGSATGLSIWVTLVFACALGVWALVLIVRPGTEARASRAEASAVMLAGVIAAVCVLPFFLDLAQANQIEAHLPIVFKVRSFLPIEVVLESAGITSSFARSVINLVVLPVNYTLEFGYFAVGAMLYWDARTRQDIPVQRGDWMLILLCGTSTVVCTLFASAIKHNDLGWRGLQFAQYVLLLWLVDITVELFRSGSRRTFSEISTSLPPRMRRVAACLLIVGAVTSVYNLTILRAFPLLSDLGFTPAPNFVAADTKHGQRVYAVRSIYASLQEHLPASAIIQHNSDIDIERFHTLYGQRQVVFSDRDLGTLYGVSAGSALVPLEEASAAHTAREVQKDEPTPRYLVVSDAIAAVFAGDSMRTAAAQLCRDYSIDALVVKDIDPIWHNPASWVWEETPLLANEFARVFDCDALNTPQ